MYKGYAWHTAIGLQAVDGLKTSKYLELFLKNLLLDEENELHNRTMHISGMFETEVDIENAKVYIRNRLLSFSDMISEKTINHALGLFLKCGKEEYFGRTIVEDNPTYDELKEWYACKTSPYCDGS